MLTDGRQSFAVFTYKCGLLGWFTGAIVGFTGEGGFYGNHPLSGTRTIACLENNEWNNIVYTLSHNRQGALYLLHLLTNIVYLCKHNGLRCCFRGQSVSDEADSSGALPELAGE